MISMTSKRDYTASRSNMEFTIQEQFIYVQPWRFRQGHNAPILPSLNRCSSKHVEYESRCSGKEGNKGGSALLSSKKFCMKHVRELGSEIRMSALAWFGSSSCVVSVDSSRDMARALEFMALEEEASKTSTLSWRNCR